MLKYLALILLLLSLALVNSTKDISWNDFSINNIVPVVNAQHDGGTEDPGQAGGEANISINGNNVEMDGVSPSDVNFTSPSFQASWDPSTGHISVNGPEGTVASVTPNAEGGYDVSFSPAGGTTGDDGGTDPGGLTGGGDGYGGDTGGDNSGNSGSGGGDNGPDTSSPTQTDQGPPPCTTNCSATPPGNFQQGSPVPLSCQATGGNPVIELSWGSSTNFSEYRVFYTDLGSGNSQAQGNWSAGSLEHFLVDSSSGLTPGRTYGFLIVATNSQGLQTASDNGTWSHTLYGAATFPDCSATNNLPIISLWLNDHPHYDYPLAVKQNDPVTLRWAVTNATSCTASSSPIHNYWNGAKDAVGGTQAVNTSVIGTKRFTLTCSNSTGGFDTRNIQLSVLPPQNPYIQTTGGDVHTNETITIPQ